MNRGNVMGKIVERLESAEVATRIFDGATIALTGSGIFLEADEIFGAIEQSFLNTGRPRDLTIVHALGIGDGRDSGLSRFAHKGMVRRVIGGHWSWSPRMQKLAADNLIEAYSFPAGAISNLMREIGAKRPGLITRIGLDTFADPRRDAGRCNSAARDTLVDLIAIDGAEYLRYRPFQVDFALIRATIRAAKIEQGRWRRAVDFLPGSITALGQRRVHLAHAVGQRHEGGGNENEDDDVVEVGQQPAPAQSERDGARLARHGSDVHQPAP